MDLRVKTKKKNMVSEIDYCSVIFCFHTHTLCSFKVKNKKSFMLQFLYFYGIIKSIKLLLKSFILHRGIYVLKLFKQ